VAGEDNINIVELSSAMRELSISRKEEALYSRDGNWKTITTSNQKEL
jgi:hypothetical protein